jgi:hypothetical protein
VRGGGEEVRITCTSKDAQVVVHGRNAKEGKVRSREAQSFGGWHCGELQPNMMAERWLGKEESEPCCWWNERCARLYRLGRRCMDRTYAVECRDEECAGARVVKLASVVALNGLDGGAELGTYVGKKLRQCRDLSRRGMSTENVSNHQE